ncbi:hypothetical protein JHK86_007042 [Glycine max]|nr:hypothetical protein JHK86_007042 [Glycine max]
MERRHEEELTKHGRAVRVSQGLHPDGRNVQIPECSPPSQTKARQAHNLTTTRKPPRPRSDATKYYKYHCDQTTTKQEQDLNSTKRRGIGTRKQTEEEQKTEADNNNNNEEIVTIKVDQKQTQQCYAESLKVVAYPSTKEPVMPHPTATEGTQVMSVDKGSQI